ncbi:MAG: HEPN domain-containing protein [Candidatus Bathyarchaeia archaeon]|jgi:uncharacterized protein (UPF0332 family)
MQNDKRYLDWCLKQSKGIRIVAPSDNLVKAYREKSKNALKSMEINAQAGLVEWAVSASYYAKYFAVYSLLSKIGVKCEIHDCTITLFEYLFCDSIPKEVIKDLRESKADRVEMQYYTQQISVNLEQVIKGTKKFVLEIENVADGLNSERIAELQKRLKF